MGTHGRVFSEATRAKMRAARLGRKDSPEVLEKKRLARELLASRPRIPHVLRNKWKKENVPMSVKVPIEVQSVILVEEAGGKRLLTISSKTGPLELEFSAETWERLTDTAKWFEKRVTVLPSTTNGVHKGGK